MAKLIDVIEEFIKNKQDTITNEINTIPSVTNSIVGLEEQNVQISQDSKSTEQPLDVNHEYSAMKYRIHSKDFKYMISTEHLFSENKYMKNVLNNKGMNPLNRIFHRSAYVKHNNSLYSWGGLTNGLSAEMLVLDIDKLKITPKKQDYSIGARMFHSFDFLNHSNKFVIIGGIDKNGTILSDINIVDMNSYCKCLNDLPPLCGHATVGLFNDIFIFGGFGNNSYQNTLYVLDTSKDRLDKICATTPISPRAGSSMTIFENNIFIYGGHRRSTVFSDLYCYNIATKVFVKINTNNSPLVPSLTMATLTTNGNNLLLFGGWNGAEWNCDMFEMDTKKSNWKISTRRHTTFDSLVPFSSVAPVSGNMIVTGGVSTKVPFISFRDTFVRFVLCKEPLCQQRIPIYRALIQMVKEEETEFDQSLFYLRWYLNGPPEDCDVTILVDTEDDNQDKYYAHKIMMGRSTVLKRKIALQELGVSEISDEEISSHSMKHGEPVVIVMDRLENVTNMKVVFPRVMEYIYSGSFDAHKLSHQDFTEIYHLACYLDIPLLREALGSSTLQANHIHQYSLSRYLTEAMKTFLIISDEIIEDSNLATCETVPNGMVKLIAPITLESSQYKSVLVHKGILTTRSRYFESVFKMNFVETTTHTMIIEQNTIESVISILNYIYTSSVIGVDMTNAVEIYMSSYQFELSALHSKAKSVIREQEVDYRTAAQLAEICESIGDVTMKDYCKYILAKHFDEIVKKDASVLDGLSKELRMDIQKLSILLMKKSKK